MILHEDKDRFAQAIQTTAAYFGMRELIVEKDYWATYVLKNIATSEFRDKVVFKGGTSLSKMYNCIDRFSEDIDLAIIPLPSYTQSQITKLIKDVEKVASHGLTLIPDHSLQVKKGKNRTTAYEYQRASNESNFGNVKDVILIEINSFTTPTPSNFLPTISFIGYHFGIENLPDLEEYDLSPFDILTLDMQRTFFEKILSINRHSYTDTNALKNKIRHFYDIHKLFSHPEVIQAFKQKENSFKILNQAISDENSNRTFLGAWGGNKLTSSPLFTDLEGTWNQIKSRYTDELSELVYADLPNEKEILNSLYGIKKFLLEFDNYYPPGI